MMLRAAWTLIVAVAVYDACFAWQHRGTMHLWELNPLMAAVPVEAAIALRLGTVWIGCLLIVNAATLQAAATSLLLAVHLALAGWYVFV